MSGYARLSLHSVRAKDDVRSKMKRILVRFMNCTCPSFVQSQKKKQKMEDCGLADFRVLYSRL